MIYFDIACAVVWVACVVTAFAQLHLLLVSHHEFAASLRKSKAATLADKGEA